MIIIGAIKIAFTSEEGGFLCPNCRTERPFRRRTPRNFLTVYFIPLIPLGKEAEYVECRECRKQFDVGVLSLSPEQAQEKWNREFHEHVKRVMVMTMIADGTVDDEEVATIQRFFEQLSGRRLGGEQIASEASLAVRSRSEMPRYVASIAGKLDDEQKATLVRAAFLVASAAGGLQTPQQRQLAQMPAALSLSEDRFREIIQLALAEEHG